MMARLKSLLPYVLAALALGWVLHKTDVHALWAALQRVSLLYFVGASIVMLTINWLADTFAMTSVFGWFKVRIPFRDLFLVRGSTYLLAILNYHLGQAAIIHYLVRIRRVPLARASGMILFIIGVNAGTLFLLASAGAGTATGDLRMLRLVPVVMVGGVVVYAGLLLMKPALLTNRRLLAPLFEMGLWGHVKGVAVRLPHVFTLIIWQFIGLRLFNIQLSAIDALLYVPAYIAVCVLPLNVNGLGLAQVAAVRFFAHAAVVPAMVGGDVAAAQRAAVMAWSLSMQGFSIFFQLAVGFVCLQLAARRGVSAHTLVDDDDARDATPLVVDAHGDAALLDEPRAEVST